MYGHQEKINYQYPNEKIRDAIYAMAYRLTEDYQDQVNEGLIGQLIELGLRYMAIRYSLENPLRFISRSLIRIDPSAVDEIQHIADNFPIEWHDYLVQCIGNQLDCQVIMECYQRFYHEEAGEWWGENWINQTSFPMLEIERYHDNHHEMIHYQFRDYVEVIFIDEYGVIITVKRAPASLWGGRYGIESF